MPTRCWMRACTAALLLVAALPRAALAEAQTLRIGVQPGLTYLPFVLMEHERLIEQRAAAAGLAPVTVTWWQVSGGNVMNDAMLSGNLDIANSGTPAFFPMWARTRGSLDVKGISAYNSLPLKLNTNNPKVQTIRDFGENDRIALPAVRTSSQAIFLQMESERVFGPGQHGKLDAITISRAHPDAMIALLSGRSEITAHFGAPPYQDQELRHPGVRTILTGTGVAEGPVTIGMSYTTRKFHDENPKLYGVFFAALGAAIEQIGADRRRAAEIYIAATKEKDTIDNLVAILSDPEFQFGQLPRNMVKIAGFMHRTGSIKQDPATWRELFFAEIHQQPGS